MAFQIAAGILIAFGIVPGSSLLWNCFGRGFYIVSISQSRERRVSREVRLLFCGTLLTDSFSECPVSSFTPLMGKPLSSLQPGATRQ